MSIIRGLRYPTALAFGLLLTGATFWSLWSLTNVTFQIATVKSFPIEFPSVREDTPPEKKSREDVVILPPDIEVIEIVDIGNPPVDIETVLIKETVEKPTITRPGTIVMQDRNELPLVRIDPEYPARAQSQGIEGWVKVQFTISATGAVTDVMVVENSPSDVFDNAAVKAVSRWRYNPKIEGAVAVERVGVQTILRFNLEE